MGSRPLRRVVLAAACAAAGTFNVSAAAPQPPASGPPAKSPQTRAERTDSRETSRYDEVMAFIREVVASSPQTMRLTTFGYTFEGKPLPLVIVGRVSAATPEAVKQS